MAGHELYVGLRFMKHRGQIECRSAAADDDDSPALEYRGVGMTETVRNEFWRQRRQIGRDIFKMGNTNRKDDLARGNCLAIVEPEKKSLGCAIETHYLLIF